MQLENCHLIFITLIFLPAPNSSTDLFVEETPNANIPVLEVDSVLLLLKHYDPEVLCLLGTRVGYHLLLCIVIVIVGKIGFCVNVHLFESFFMNHSQFFVISHLISFHRILLSYFHN